jgi:hypothetical protein
VVDNKQPSIFDVNTNAGDFDTFEGNKVERLSLLSKINLLGLIYLCGICLRLSQTGNVEKAIFELQHRIEELRIWAQLILAKGPAFAGMIGIASQNIMEEYLHKLMVAQQTNFTDPEGKNVVNEHKLSLKILDKARKGKGVLANKDFMQVFFITCFLPFIHPSLPQLKENEIKQAKKNQKGIVKLFKDRFHSDSTDKLEFDFDFYQ